MKTATFIKQLDGFNGDARLFKLNPPINESYWDEVPKSHEYVIVSAVRAMFSGPETYIFPANENGEVTSFGELPGSFRGGLDHEEALNNAGYDVQWSQSTVRVVNVLPKLNSPSMKRISHDTTPEN